jgi:hypothetical protein
VAQTQATFEVEIVGVYHIEPTEETIAEAARYHDYDWLLDEDGNYIDEIDWSNHENLGLVELKITGDISPAEFANSISQEDQVPYMEFWTDRNGNRIIPKEEADTTEGRRVCFFLHFIDHIKPLIVAGKDFRLPAWSTLPDRLTPFTYYVPVD